MRLTKIILESNGINDDLYLSDKFWNEYVDISDHNTFLESLVDKDLGGKKKALRESD